MLIDKFTADELVQIRRELRMVQTLHKGTLNNEVRKKLEELFDIKTYHDQSIFPIRTVEDAITTIADYTLDNFVYKNQGNTKKQIGWYRSQNITQTMEPEYREMLDELMEVITKHRKQKEFSLKR